MTGRIDLVMVAWAASSLLFLIALWAGSVISAYRRQYAAFAGAAILSASAIYSADAVHLPDITATLLIGTLLAWLLARGLTGRALAASLPGMAGLIGIAMLCAGIVGFLNPNAFGLLAEESSGLAHWAGPCLAAVILLGAGAALCSVMAWLRLGKDEVRQVSALALAGGLAGYSVATLGFLFQHAGLAIAGGLGGTAGLVLAARLRRGVHAKGLAQARRRA